MSILNAIKQQGSSIDDLSKLPQAMIMQMVQKKQIDEAMLAPILARKAEMADAVARNKTLQGGGAQMPSVMEQLMQKTADQEQPEPDAREMGIASNSIPERNYAGGGIVAFDDGGAVDAPARKAGETENDYMKRVQMLSELGGQFFTPRNYDPIAKLKDLYGAYQENIGQPIAAGIKRFTEESPESQAAKFRSYSQQPKVGEVPPTAVTKAEPKVQPGIASLAKAADTTSPTSPAKVKQSALEKATGAPEKTETKPDYYDNLIATLTKKLEGDPEAAAKARKEAMWARGAEAGLNIMGGTSSNFAQNLALASPAIKGYGEDIKGIRAEDAAKMAQLMGLGLKGAALKQEAKKLGITEKHFDQMYKAQMAQIGEMGASRREGAALRADTAMDNRVVTLAGKLMAQPKYMENPEAAYADAQRMVTGQGSSAPVPTYNPQTRTFK